MKTIGIVGGAGPMAGALLLKKVIQKCQGSFGCSRDADFPKILLVSVPFTEMLEEGIQERQITQELEEALYWLQGNGADVMGIACNTLHGFLENSFDSLIDLIQVTRQYLDDETYSKVLVLCTKTSVEKEVHQCPSALYLDGKEQQFLDKVIQKVMAGKHSFRDQSLLEALIESKKDQDPDIDGVLLGCTELSVLFDEYPSGQGLIDPLDLLSNKILF